MAQSMPECKGYDEFISDEPAPFPSDEHAPESTPDPDSNGYRLTRPKCLDKTTLLSEDDTNNCIGYFWRLQGEGRHISAEKRRLLYQVCERKGWKAKGFPTQEKFLTDYVNAVMRINANYAKKWLAACKLENELRSIVQILTNGNVDILADDLTENQLRFMQRIECTVSEKAEIYVKARIAAKGNPPKASHMKPVAIERGFTIRADVQSTVTLPDTPVASAATFYYSAQQDSVSINHKNGNATISKALVPADDLLADIPTAKLEAYLAARRASEGANATVIKSLLNNSKQAEVPPLCTIVHKPEPGQLWEQNGVRFRVDGAYPFGSGFGGREFVNGSYLRDTRKDVDYFQSATLISA